MRKLVVALSLLAIVGTLQAAKPPKKAASAGRAGCIDHKIFDGILRANVDPYGYVDYNGIRINKGGDLYEYLAFLEDANLTKCTDAEKTAFWINAYNANMILKILARPKMESISEDFKIFGERFSVANLQLSLNDIQHRVLRSAEKNGGPIEGVSIPNPDPRVHFALTGGALGAPALLNRAYAATTLDEQLQTRAVRFANTPRYIRVQDGKLILSSILKWYENDFLALGGVAAYIAKLTDPAERPDAAEVDAKLASEADFKAAAYEYDWTLNSVQHRPAQAPAPTK